MSDDRLLSELGKIAREQEGDREQRARDRDDELFRPVSEAEQRAIEEKVIPRLGSRRIRWQVGIPFAIAAAIVAAVVLLRADPSPPLPSYRLEVASYSNDGMRSDHEPTSAVLVLSAGMRLEVNLRPEVPVDGKIGARSFVFAANDKQEVHLRIEIDSAGAVRFVGRVGSELALPAGRARVVFAVGRPTSVAAWDGTSEGSDDVSVHAVEVELASNG